MNNTIFLRILSGMLYKYTKVKKEWEGRMKVKIRNCYRWMRDSFRTGQSNRRLTCSTAQISSWQCFLSSSVNHKRALLLWYRPHSWFCFFSLQHQCLPPSPFPALAAIVIIDVVMVSSSSSNSSSSISCWLIVLLVSGKQSVVQYRIAPTCVNRWLLIHDG